MMTSFPSSDQTVTLREVTITTRGYGKTEGGNLIPGLFRCSFEEGVVEDPVYKKGPGTAGGGHYHLVGDPSKTPERLRFLHGSADLKLIFPDGVEYIVHLSPSSNEILIVEIPPRVWHQLSIKAFSIFSESRVTPFDPNRTYTVVCSRDEYLQHMQASIAPVAV